MTQPWLNLKMLRFVASKWCRYAPLTGSTWINARILEQPSAIMVWVAARILDCETIQKPDSAKKRVTGTGRVTTTVEDLSYMLGRSQPTIKRLLRQAKALGYLRAVEKERGSQVLQLYLASEKSIFLSKGLTVGPRIEVSEDDLRRRIGSMRCEATEAEAKALQHKSLNAARKSLKGSSEVKNQAIEETDEFVRQSSFIGLGANSANSFHRFTYIPSETVAYGGSQATIAKSIDRSQRTVQRRLSNKFRQKIGLPRLPRTQILKAYSSGCQSVEKIKFMATFSPTVNLTDGKGKSVKVMFRSLPVPKLKNKPQQQTEEKNSIAWQYHPNLYFSDLITRLDRRLKKSLAGWDRP